MMPLLAMLTIPGKLKLPLIVALIVVLLWLGLRWANSRTRPGHRLGIVDGRLAPCPDRPNCVSTRAEDSRHQIRPLEFEESPGEALRRIERIVDSMSGGRVVSSGDGYLRAEFRSGALGFVDDVEFAVDDEQKTVHFRSASRVGYSDFGVNRRRMEEIRRRFENRD